MTVGPNLPSSRQDTDARRGAQAARMAAANHETRYWRDMKALGDSVTCGQQLLPAFNSWPYADMGFGYGEAGFVLFKPLHCGL